LCIGENFQISRLIIRNQTWRVKLKKLSFVEMKAPDFALRDQHGRIVRLRDFRGKKVVLYFYVRDDTPGCTKEACSFRDSLRKMKAKDVIVLGVSPDSADSHKRFADKFNLTFPLLVDEKARIAKRLGVWGKKNMYGRTCFGIVRSTFIIDEDGKVKKQYSRVRVPGHLAKIIKDLD
jgi:peroxiredoxin Q/BCP